MCSIIAVNGYITKENLVSMLSSLDCRGPDGIGVYSNNRIYYNSDVNNITGSTFSMAHNLLSIVGINELQPIKSGNLSMVSNAEIYNYKQLANKFNFKNLKTRSDCEIILKIIEYYYTDDLKEAVTRATELLDGDYAFCITDDENYVVVRDKVGVKPVYYGNNSDYFAVASEAKALKSIGIKDVHNLNPNYMIYNDDLIRFRDFYRHENIYTNRHLAEEDLKQALIDSVYKRTHNLDKVALLFSGGVDSSLIAHILKMQQKDLTLYTVGIETSQDLKIAKKVARDMDLPLKTWVIDQEVIEDAFLPTINAIEDTNLMKIGVGMTVKLTSQLAREDDHKVILSGQGADELFAGYNRYKKSFDNTEALIGQLDHDLNNIYDVNMERDDKACMSNSVELRVPYLDKQVIKCAQRMPVEYLLSSSDDKLRKNILRDVAYSLGLDKDVAYRPKKAAQYGTGIDKIIRKKVIKNEQYSKILAMN